MPSNEFTWRLSKDESYVIVVLNVVSFIDVLSTYCPTRKIIGKCGEKEIKKKKRSFWQNVHCKVHQRHDMKSSEHYDWDFHHGDKISLVTRKEMRVMGTWSKNLW